MAVLMHELIGAPKRTVAPTLYPVTLKEAFNALQIIDSESQASMADEVFDLLKQATDIVERDSRRMLMPQTWQLHLDSFPSDAITLRKFPVATFTHIKYYLDSVLTTWSSANYQTDLITEPCRVKPISGLYWPTPDYGRMNAVQVEWVAGYASAAVVPQCAKAAVLMVLRHLYDPQNNQLCGNYQTMIARLIADGFVS